MRHQIRQPKNVLVEEISRNVAEGNDDSTVLESRIGIEESAPELKFGDFKMFLHSLYYPKQRRQKTN